MTSKAQVLLAQQADLDLTQVELTLRENGCEVRRTAGLVLREELAKGDPDLVVLGLQNTQPVAELVRQTFREGLILPPPVLVICGDPDVAGSHAAALNAGADNFLPIETQPDEMLAVIHSLLRRSQYRRRFAREAERRFSRIFENAAVGIAQLTPQGSWLRVNERLCQMLGYSRDELLASNFQKITHAPDLEADLALLRKLLDGEIPSYQMEKRYIHHDGHLVWASLHVGLERDEAGRPKYLVSVVEEITDRKRAEQLRAFTDERLTAALRASATGTFRWDIKEDRLFWDSSLKNIFGYPASHEVRRIGDFTRCLHPDDRNAVFAQLDQCRATGSDFDLEFRIVWPDGTVRWLSDRGRMFLDDEGRPDYMTGACLDITARKQADAELRANAERLRLAFRSAKAGSFDWDIVNDRAQWSPELEDLYGLAPDSWSGDIKAWTPLLHPDDREDCLAMIQRSFKTGELSGQWRILRPDGQVRWISGAGKVFYGSNGEPVRMLGMNMDITEQKTAEQALRERAQIIDHIHDAIATADLDNRITMWSKGAERIFGYTWEEVRNQHVTLVHEHGEQDTLLTEALEALQEHGVFERDGRLRKKSGEVFDAHMSIAVVPDERGKPAGAIAYMSDITERKRTEHALRVSEKLAATGRLASTLAHEINNPLASITNLLYLLNANPNLDEASRQYVTLAEAELSRVTHITRNLLSFHRDSQGPQIVDPAEVMDGLLELYDPKLRVRQVDLRRHYRDATTVKLYPGELKQVFSNLLENALDALPDAGTIQVSVKHLARAPQEMVQITVADNGKGIDLQHLTQVFEPFFTTKGEKGTGLGLWVTKDIVSKQGGRIRMRSRPGAGSVFTVVLPCESAGEPVRSSAIQANAAQ